MELQAIRYEDNTADLLFFNSQNVKAFLDFDFTKRDFFSGRGQGNTIRYLRCYLRLHFELNTKG